MLTEHLPQLLLAWSIQATGVMSPGPGVMLILGVASTRGRGAALTTCVGIGGAAMVLATVTVVGLAAVFAQIAGLMLIVKLIGAAYLLWLAWGSFNKALSPPPLSARDVAPQSALKTLLLGFTMQMSNPKALVFWLAIAAIGGVGDAPLGVVVLFILGAFVISFTGHATWALTLSSGPFRALYARARRPIEATLGLLFCVFAVKLAFSRT